ncbi:MAG: flagellar protein FlgN [Firmicutes bacterium]|nr:flagellar protein FlgN [Bacillota bacterium]
MDQFEQIINQMIALFEENLPLEQEKLRAVQEDDVAAVEDCMKREQAVVLQMRGLEKKREDIQKANGWAGLTFREIIAKAPREKQHAYSQLLEKLENSISLFQDANECAMDTLRIHQKEIEKVIKFKDPNGTYNQEGQQAPPKRPMTNRRV